LEVAYCLSAEAIYDDLFEFIVNPRLLSPAYLALTTPSLVVLDFNLAHGKSFVGQGNSSL
jgi:hypothetical protein